MNHRCNSNRLRVQRHSGASPISHRAATVWVDPRPPKLTLTAEEKVLLLRDVRARVDKHRPARAEPTPEDNRVAYPTDYQVKWRGPYIVISATFVSPKALNQPAFVESIVRLGYLTRGQFSLWVPGHRGWVPMEESRTLDECFEHMREMPWAYLARCYASA